jgi:hypothetical protein
VPAGQRGPESATAVLTRSAIGDRRARRSARVRARRAVIAAAAGGACPRKALPLPPDALAGATRAALREAPSLYGGTRGIDTRDRRATRAALANVAGTRGSQVRRECGRRVQRRTVVVDLEFPRMLPSASLSQGTLFIARLRRGYQVWHVAY